MNLLRLILVILLLSLAGISSADRRFVVGFAQDTLANDWCKVQVQAVLAQHPNITLIRRTANFLRADALRAVSPALAASLEPIF